MALQVRRKRRADEKGFRLKKATWVDPFPFVPGTEPEKRIFEVLMRRHIYFQFQADLPELAESRKTLLNKQLKVLEAEIRKLIAEEAKFAKKQPKTEALIKKKIADAQKLVNDIGQINELDKTALSGAFLFQPGFKPDFILPEYKMIIDPFGIFHHSLPDAVQRDYIKQAVYRSLGYRFYHPWWDDKGFLWADGVVPPLKFERIGYDANLLLDRMPELLQGIKYPLTDPVDIAAKKNPGYLLGKNLGAGASSVAIANRLRTRQKVLGIRTRGRKSRRAV